MIKYSVNDNYKLYQGDMLDLTEVVKPNSIDSVITDPPYELNFMNKGWDNSGIAFQKGTWEKCYEVLKPGGYLLAFGGSRTFHRIACAIEDAGFEIRDTIMWLYGSGFPKSMNIGKAIEGKLTIGSANVKDIKKLDGEKTKVTCGFNKTGKETGYRDKEYEMVKTEVNYHTDLGKQWSGWGTALKPSYEPIIVARKPFKGSLVDNVMKYGVGGINNDECRIGSEERTYKGMSKHKPDGAGTFRDDNWVPKDIEVSVSGRFPANTILTYDETDKEEVCGGFPNTKSVVRKPSGGRILNPENGWNNNSMTDTTVRGFADDGSAARYFYCAKASKKDRNEGLGELPDKPIAFSNQAQAELKRGGELKNGGLNNISFRKNIHPTVKPTSLMQYLVRLVTPNGGTVLDPFNGSGSTGKAVMYENKERHKDYKYIGIELSEDYLAISKARIDYVIEEKAPEEPEQIVMDWRLP